MYLLHVLLQYNESNKNSWSQKKPHFLYAKHTSENPNIQQNISLCLLLATTTFKFLLLYTSFVFIVNMKEQQSNLLECFACIYVCYIYEMLWKTWTSETRMMRMGFIILFDTKSKSAKALTPFMYNFSLYLHGLCYDDKIWKGGKHKQL